MLMDSVCPAFLRIVMDIGVYIPSCEEYKIAAEQEFGALLLYSLRGMPYFEMLWSVGKLL